MGTPFDIDSLRSKVDGRLESVGEGTYKEKTQANAPQIGECRTNVIPPAYRSEILMPKKDVFGSQYTWISLGIKLVLPKQAQCSGSYSKF
jgi:hypothetical protein